MTTLVVIAKECLPGTVKTRLHPPFSLRQAATLAAASLEDTLTVAARVPATRRVLYFDGDTPPATAGRDWEVVSQCEGTLDVRLAGIFDLLDEPMLLIGMDTPHVTPGMLAPAFESWPSDVDAWIGAASDGGFWALGLADPRGRLTRGIQMSRPNTGAEQRRALVRAGLRVRDLVELRDVDTAADAAAVAAQIPNSLFGLAFRNALEEL
ncbi:TIGR04282 family arsenosugar biosynthesis glycosyltransferase [Glaciibacter psychrotolerans]|uniref:DUF2064 domain-containing protein n=1 Tax=Glaciibacter psychrotolerans TaxID=670054 RepID=A0A7Z0ECE8_9MICO|nr:DUF2064 domain-containing protein [Leifsonia psychrotolerans]NYJ19092.1 hypothetical protein [Leifsonia psychrotolerans]